jgi:WS/DGAT/MGAT family acyltransferase
MTRLLERVGGLDANFLAIEDAANHMHIGSVGIFAGPAPSYDELCNLIGSKLAQVPRYRQKVRMAPASIGRPVWIDDPGFRLQYHVRHCALPRPGGDLELRSLVEMLMSQQLDRHKPLWEDWMVEGLEDGRWALITKVHHCMVDGIAGSDLLALVLDPDPDARPVAQESWVPAPEPGVADLALHSLRGLAGAPGRWLTTAGDAVRHRRAILTRAADITAGLGRLGGLIRPAPHSSLTGSIGTHRRWAWTRATLAEIKEIRSVLGGTVNDVVLAAVTRGFHDLLEHRGEPLEGRKVRSLVPVSLRTPDARGVFDNRVTAVFAELPVGIDEPVERLHQVRVQMDALKLSHEADASEALSSLASFAPPLVTALMARLSVHHQHSIETITTNVAGPQHTLYALGRPMLEAYPYAPISGRIQVSVAIWSYDGGVHIGVTGDWDAAPDLEVLTAGIDDGLRELRQAARANRVCSPPVTSSSGQPPPATGAGPDQDPRSESDRCAGTGSGRGMDPERCTDSRAPKPRVACRDHL